MHCQASINPGDKFCSSCGKEAYDPENFCFNCNELLAPGDVFCSKCGAAKQVPCAGCGAGVPANEDVCPECGLSQKSHQQDKISNFKDDREKAKQVVKLIGAPIGLSELKRDYGWLTTPMSDAEYDRFWGALYPMVKGSIPVELRAGSARMGARDFFIKKAGFFKRFLTIFIDYPIYFAFFLGVLALLIGSAKQGSGIIPVTGDARAAVAWVWFFVSYFIYFVLMEKVFMATIGGLILGMRVVDGYGNALPYSTLIWRNGCKLIPFLGPIWIDGTLSKRLNCVVEN
jgi:uncharacterized RDD family membrane protein YckC/predicted nucleic acid-binding Zn ribbon protein